jgi:hypothetical protein
MSQAMQKVDTVGHSTPLRAVRQHCVWCCNGSFNEVRLCPVKSCPLWPFRRGHRPDAEDRAAAAGREIYPLERHLTGASGLKAIRKRCVDCSGNSDPAVRACAFNGCSLHPFRFGKNRYLAPRSDEWRRAATERLASLKCPGAPPEPSRSLGFAGAHVLEGEQPPENSPS